MKYFVIGGAGYVGSHFVKEAIRRNETVVVYDNLSRGHREAIDEQAGFIEGDILDTDRLSKCLKDEMPDCVLHFAAFALVPESVSDPLMYYKNNVTGVISLLDAMVSADVKVPLVFSSTCAVFGTPAKLPMEEDDPKKPESPYGTSKLMAEQVIEDVALAEGIPAMALRYFNACGADKSGEIGEKHEPETHLIPNVIKAALGGKTVQIFGSDFDTKDGSCVRDYIHVTDLALAHIGACAELKKIGKGYFDVAHLGTGNGYSNFEILKAIEEVSGLSIKRDIVGRRKGDPAALYTSNRKAKEKIGFTHEHSDLKNIIETALTYHKKFG